MRFTRYLFAPFALALSALPSFAGEPPAALFFAPPAAIVSEPEYDAKAACVSVWTAPNGSGARAGGSGVVIASGDGASLVVTNNHIFSDRHHPEGGFYDDVYPQPATVRAGGKEYRATALSANRTADIAIVVVEGALVPAKIADGVPPVGTKVWRNGIGSGYQTGVVIPPENNLERFSITVRGHSISGDSGAGYFTEQNELVGINCGKDGAGNPRGTSVTVVKTVVTAKAPLRLFPRLRARLENRAAGRALPPMVNPEPPEARVAGITPCTCGCVVTGSCTCKNCNDHTGEKGRQPVPVPNPTPGYRVTPGSATAGDCPGGRCPLPGSSGATASGGCSGGSCSSGNSGWYFGKNLGRRR